MLRSAARSTSSPRARRTRLPNKSSKRKINYKKKCDELWSKVVRGRDGGCLLVGVGRKCSGVLHADHVINRWNHTLRHDPRNGVALCAGHHLFWKPSHPVEYTEWFIKTYPHRHAYLVKRRQVIEKPDYKERYIKLKSLLEDIESSYKW